MKITRIHTFFLLLLSCSLLQAEVLVTARFDPQQPDTGWSAESSGFFEDARLTQPAQSHHPVDHSWAVPANYGLPLSTKAVVSRSESFDGQMFRLLGSQAVLKPGVEVYFSFTLSAKLHGGTRFLFARAGTESHLHNANLQVIQIRTGAFRLLDDNETLAETEDTYFEKNTLVVGSFNYDTGEFKLKVYCDDQLIDENPVWDIESVAVPHNVYDRLAFRVAPNAFLGNIVIGNSWHDVTGVKLNSSYL